MTALHGLAGCFSRNAYRDVHIRQSMQLPVPARPVRCQAHKNAEHPQMPDARGIFEMSPPCCEATLLDARDALETCSILDEKSKQACYAQFGCDGQRVERYFHSVEILENAWQQEEDTDDDDDEYLDHSKCDWPWQVFNRAHPDPPCDAL